MHAVHATELLVPPTSSTTLQQGGFLAVNPWQRPAPQAIYTPKAVAALPSSKLQVKYGSAIPPSELLVVFDADMVAHDTFYLKVLEARAAEAPEGGCMGCTLLATTTTSSADWWRVLHSAACNCWLPRCQHPGVCL
jgi:hypothetical protein